jgi:hypothetical protein
MEGFLDCRETLEAAGPAFIKWGQWASTRADMFPPDMCRELEGLQTRAPAHSLAFTERVIEVRNPLLEGLSPRCTVHTFRSCTVLLSSQKRNESCVIPLPSIANRSQAHGNKENHICTWK